VSRVDGAALHAALQPGGWEALHGLILPLGPVILMALFFMRLTSHGVALKVWSRARMRPEWRWALFAAAALAIGAGAAQRYCGLAAPYYTLAARWIAFGHPWKCSKIEVVNSGPGMVVALDGYGAR